MKNITLVTGLWDIKRSDLGVGWTRSFEDHYIAKFKQLLEVPYNLIVFGEESLRDVVFNVRNRENTQFIVRNQSWFKNDFYGKVQEIRNKPEWYNQAGWLKESTQAKLDMYNPLVMSKVFLLNDASIMDKFDSEYMFWIDAGLTNTVHQGYFTKHRVLDQLPDLVHNFTFVAFPYKANTEIHGFSFPDINSYAGKKVELVGRGGFFGGPKESIAEINGIYYSLLTQTLNDGYMGTEESIFSILIYKYPSLVSYAKIKGDGLLGTFFENLRNNKATLHSFLPSKNNTPLNFKKAGLYVIGFNSPDQFERLCESFKEYDNDFLTLPKKYLLNNSTNKDTFKRYSELCKKYGFEEIKKNNIGICGGRQFIAEHFAEQKDLDYYYFFEDDMTFYLGNDVTCKNGMVRKVEHLYKKTLTIAHIESFDFLKLNFTEFFGDNQRQWSWHNVPSKKRKEHFPDKPFKSSNNVLEAPYMNYENIKSKNQLAYATGEVFYCNWPQVVSREGNQKMFLDTTWKFPYEQTWMSHFYQMTVKGGLKPGILLATPTEHDRFDHYPAKDRREN